jgi:hypothetical protein
MPETESQSTGTESPPKPVRRISVFGRHFQMPRSRWRRITIGVGLIVFGIFGFLPVLGFWMIPLGLLVLSYEFHVARRLRRRFVIWRERRRKAAGA